MAHQYRTTKGIVIALTWINLSAQTFSTYEYARVYNINGADDYTGGNESFFDLTAYSSAIVVVEVEFDD